MVFGVKTLLLLFTIFTDLCLSQTTNIGHLPHNFTLSALNTTLPNANSTGAPLVLGQSGKPQLFVLERVLTRFNRR